MSKLEELEQQLKSIQSEIDKLKQPKIEVGKWYKARAYAVEWLINVVSFENNIVNEYYGFSDFSGFKSNVGKGTKWGNIEDLEFLIPATESEVFEALKKEAIKRGFKEGVKFRSTYHGKEWTDGTVGEIKFGINFSSNLNTVLFSGNHYIFTDGKWAEIIKDEPIKICGYEVKKESDEHNTTFLYKIGCKTFKHSEILGIKIMMSNKGFKTVSFDGIETDLETINKILNL